MFLIGNSNAKHCLNEAANSVAVSAFVSVSVAVSVFVLVPKLFGYRLGHTAAKLKRHMSSKTDGRLPVYFV